MTRSYYFPGPVVKSEGLLHSKKTQLSTYKKQFSDSLVAH